MEVKTATMSKNYMYIFQFRLKKNQSLVHQCFKGIEKNFKASSYVGQI